MCFRFLSVLARQFSCTYRPCSFRAATARERHLPHSVDHSVANDYRVLPGLCVRNRHAFL